MTPPHNVIALQVFENLLEPSDGRQGAIMVLQMFSDIILDGPKCASVDEMGYCILFLLFTV